MHTQLVNSQEDRVVIWTSTHTFTHALTHMHARTHARTHAHACTRMHAVPLFMLTFDHDVC